MYTPIIAPAGLSSHIYPEILAEITRDDNGALATTAISTAIQEVKAYLSKYDLVQLFGDPVANTAATFTDGYLTHLVKCVACWQLIILGNPNLHYEHFRTLYDDAISQLKSIQKGTMQPPSWPYMNTVGETFPQGDAVSAQSYPKRHNDF